MFLCNYLVQIISNCDTIGSWKSERRYKACLVCTEVGSQYSVFRSQKSERTDKACLVCTEVSSQE